MGIGHGNWTTRRYSTRGLPIRGLVSSRTGQLVQWTACGLVNLQSRELVGCSTREAAADSSS